MPRMLPPQGYMSGKEACSRLNISDTLLRKHVRKGKLKKYGPIGSTYKPWYKEEEVEGLFFAQQMLEEAYVKGSYKNNPTSSFEVAQEADMPSIIDIDTRTFRHPAASLEVCLTWLRKNPHCFYVLRNEDGIVRAYASLIPLDKSVIDQFVRGELKGEDITAEMIGEYVAGIPIHVYVMAIAVSPDCSRTEKDTYGGHIVLGLIRFLLSLANQGVDIRTISASNYMEEGEDGLRLPDGLRLLRKMGFTQIKSNRPGVGLFVINVPESGIALFERYSQRLKSWKSIHKEKSA